MSKMSKAIAVLGVVAGLGVAAMPLSSYAAGNVDSKNATVEVTVGGGISLTIVDPVAGQPEGSKATLDLDTRTLNLGEAKLGGDIVSGSMGVKVATNDPAGYTLKMSAANLDMTGAAGSIKAGIPTANGENSAWGFKVGSGAWTALTAAGYDIYSDAEGATLGQTSAGDDAENPIVPAVQTTDITFGVNASANQAEGDYATTVLFTATVK